MGGQELKEDREGGRCVLKSQGTGNKSSISCLSRGQAPISTDNVQKGGESSLRL